MSKTVKEFQMPGDYVEMDSAEIEFDGGWSWNKFWNVVAVTCFAIALVVGFVSTGGTVGVALAAVKGCAIAIGALSTLAAYDTGKIGIGSMTLYQTPEDMSKYCSGNSTLGSGSDL